MAFHLEQKDDGKVDIVFDGFEKGIAPSPHLGIANMQGVNISTELKEVMCSYIRSAQTTQTPGVTGTLTPTSLSTVSVSTTGGTLLAGSWIHITADSGTGLSGDYYYLGSGKLSSKFSTTTNFQITNIQSGQASTEVFLTSGTTYSVPAAWNNTQNTVETIGAGGGGGGSTSSPTRHGAGAGGGAYSKVSNITLTPSGSATYAIGAAGTGSSGASGTDGGDTWFNGASLGASSVGAKGGVGGIMTASGTPQTGGAGGASASGVGTTKYSGGNGGTASDSAPTTDGAGGGGAAGSSGAGNNGGDSNATNSGGQGDQTFGGAGGTSDAGVGGNGTEWTTKGSGGGGGGKVGSGDGGAGGLYGGGGGGGGYGSGSHKGGDGTAGLIRITYTPTTPIISSATFSVYSMTKPIQSAFESYQNSAGQQYRYYILDDSGRLWVHDTQTFSGTDTPVWAMVNAPFTLGTRIPGGLCILNGWVSITLGADVYWSSTSKLGTINTTTSIQLSSPFFHPALVGHQGKAYWGDGVYIASLFPNTALLGTGTNVQSYCQWSAFDSTTGQIDYVLSGSNPIAASGVRVPVFFISDGTLPSAITAGTQYYIKWLSSSGSNVYFEVYAAQSGGSALNISTGSSGTHYFNTFYPINAAGQNTLTFTQQRLNLPAFETIISLGEIGNQILIGCKGNTIYPWDQVSALPSNFIVLPENNVVKILTVNNIGYAFAGSKGNIYITNGSTATLSSTVPDYCAGIAGTPATYVEQYFVWLDAMYLRGRVFFSIQDQTSTKAGNCGGIWSFDPNSDEIKLRLENQSSYATYSGGASVLLASGDQSAKGPQYYTGWYSSTSSATYGIDFSGTTTGTTAIIEADLMETGTLLNKKTFSQIEYKLAAPLASGESVALSYRQNGSDSYTSLGTAITETATALAGYVKVNFQKGQWLQIKAVLTPLSSASSSFVRLKEIRVR